MEAGKPIRMIRQIILKSTRIPSKVSRSRERPLKRNQKLIAVPKLGYHIGGSCPINAHFRKKPQAEDKCRRYQDMEAAEYNGDLHGSHSIA